jgi:hypothetical protein
VEIVEAANGNDAYDDLNAGLWVADFVPIEEQAKRRLVLTPASAIKPRRVCWLAVMLMPDPLISRLDPDLDSHKDAEVRLALEPMVAMADEIGLSVLGLIHHNKSGSPDPLQVVMASKAFPAVARSVHAVVPDPDDETNARKLLGTPKNNLGRVDLPTLGFTIDSYPVETDDDVAWTGRLVWGADSTATIFDAMRRSAETSEQTSAAFETPNGTTTTWPRRVARQSRHRSRRRHVQPDKRLGLRRAREQLGLVFEHTSGAAGQVTLWTLPESVSKGS